MEISANKTVRRRDDRGNGIIWLLILFLLLGLTIGLLSYLSRPMLVVDKPDTKLAAVGITIQDVDTANPVEIEQVPKEPEKVEAVVYEKPKKHVPQIVVVPEVVVDEPVLPVTPTVIVATTTVTSSPEVVVNSYTLTYAPGDYGTLIGSTSQIVISGDNGTEVTVVPDEKYRFVEWSDGSDSNPRIDLKIVDNISVTAKFGVIQAGVPMKIHHWSPIATITSGTYTVSAGGTANETITGIPFATDKATFLSALTKGQADQTWNDKSINDPVVSNDTLVVTAQNGTAVVTYTVTVDAPPPPPGGPG